MAQLFDKNVFMTAFKAAPRAVQQAMQSEETTLTVERIGKTFNLHVDTVGTLSGQIGYMLLGLLDPKTFYSNLLGLGIDPKDATEIARQINQDIFLPLQKHIREGGADEIEEEEPEGVYDPSVTEEALAPAPREQAPQVPVMQVQAQPEPPIVQAAPIEAPSYNLIAASKAPEAPVPTMRTMQHDMDLIQHGNAPVPYAAPASLNHPSQATPARMFQTASVPFTSPPPLPVKPQEIVHIVPDVPTPSPRTLPQIAPVKDSSSDPYRESI